MTCMHAGEVFDWTPPPTPLVVLRWSLSLLFVGCLVFGRVVVGVLIRVSLRAFFFFFNFFWVPLKC